MKVRARPETSLALARGVDCPFRARPLTRAHRRRCRKLPSKRRQFAGILFAGAAAGSQLSLLLEHNARRSPFGGFTRCCAHSCLRPQNAIAARRADPAPAPTQRRHRAAAKHHGRGPDQPKFNSSRPRPAPVGDRAETKGGQGRPVVRQSGDCDARSRRARTRPNL